MTGVYENIDCIIGMARYEDNHFDLAIVDPPYGIGANREKPHNGWNDYGIKDWDMSAPDEKYFDELFRVSKNQIICGGNYFTKHLPSSMGWVFWDKGQRNFSCSDGELIFTSFNKALRVYGYPRAKLSFERGIHPTQKPIALYKWLLIKYAKEGDLILDTHVGSGSSLIAFEDMGFDYVGFEIDEDYFNNSKKRLEYFRSEPRFGFIEDVIKISIEQKELFND